MVFVDADQRCRILVQISSSDCPGCGPQHGPDWGVCLCASVCCQPAGPHALPSLHATHGSASVCLACIVPLVHEPLQAALALQKAGLLFTTKYVMAGSDLPLTGSGSVDVKVAMQQHLPLLSSVM